jgi:hypothetical protein
MSVVIFNLLDEHRHVGLAGLGHECGRSSELDSIEEVVVGVAEDVDRHLAGDETDAEFAGGVEQGAD